MLRLLTIVAIASFLIAPAYAEGRLSIVEENPHYLAVDGVPVFALGATHQHSWTPISRPQVNLTQDIDRLAAMVERIGSPHVRGFVRCLPYDPLNHFHDGEVERTLQPWLRLDDGRFDLERFAPEWEARLTAFLYAAHQNSIIVSLEIWDDWSVTRGEGGAWDPGPGAAWHGHPFNPNNNVNYGPEILPETTSGCDAPFYQTIPSKSNIEIALGLQKHYVNRLLEIAAEYPNVFFNLSNETRASLEWSRYWAEYLRERLPAERMICEMPSTNRRDGGGECDYDLNPLTLAVDYRYDLVDIAQGVSGHEFGSDPQGQALGGAERIRSYYAAMREAGRIKPLVVSKDYTRDRAGGGEIVIWSRFVGGAATARFHRPGGVGLEMTEFQYGAIERLGRFIAEVPFWTMRPAPETVAQTPGEVGVNALAKPGEHYIFQVLGIGEGEALGLQIEPGAYQCRWIDPATGETVERFSLNAIADEASIITAPIGKEHLILGIQR